MGNFTEINDKYIRLYATVNSQIPSLMDNSGAIVIYKNVDTNMYYTYLNGDVIASGYGLADMSYVEKLSYISLNYDGDISYLTDRISYALSYSGDLYDKLMNNGFIKSYDDISYCTVTNSTGDIFAMHELASRSPYKYENMHVDNVSVTATFSSLQDNEFDDIVLNNASSGELNLVTDNEIILPIGSSISSVRCTMDVMSGNTTGITALEDSITLNTNNEVNTFSYATAITPCDEQSIQHINFIHNFNDLILIGQDTTILTNTITYTCDGTVSYHPYDYNSLSVSNTTPSKENAILAFSSSIISKTRIVPAWLASCKSIASAVDLHENSPIKFLDLFSNADSSVSKFLIDKYNENDVEFVFRKSSNNIDRAIIAIPHSYTIYRAYTIDKTSHPYVYDIISGHIKYGHTNDVDANNILQMQTGMYDISIKYDIYYIDLDGAYLQDDTIIHLKLMKNGNDAIVDMPGTNNVIVETEKNSFNEYVLGSTIQDAEWYALYWTGINDII